MKTILLPTIIKKGRTVKTTPKTAALVLARLAIHIAETEVQDRAAARDICSRIDTVLDDLLDEDAFGTEGQNDPRGDRRNLE